ncbi:hypothetical protein EF903_04015 [Streptomyces sp. WAC05292]|uniref:hypothetical protein n=1 Tax=Streptomyces sp. WAC05292 TaxID=2487418 RepID=UPI000F7395FA|nr:hypothetical protein [Streptomyces sp. WAC05292]RSS95888.1 hypothetical protein EF903_04015 [Streptomyces sp. WAC05292]
MPTINMAVPLAVVVSFRLRRRTRARSRAEERTTALIIPAPGVLLAPTPVGRRVLGVLGRPAGGVTRAGR